MKTRKTVQSLSTKRFSTFILFLLIALSLQAKDYPFSEKSWTIINAENNQEIKMQLAEEDGTPVLQLPKSGIALLNTGFSNFVLEFDVKGGAMPGVGFRLKNMWNYEYFYLRLMNSGKETALQYFPVYNGATAWQVYNYPKYESEAEFAQDDWIHVKLMVYDDNMRVFINDRETPNMEVKLKYNELTKGKIFLESGFVDSAFKKVKVEELTQGFEVKETKNTNQYISQWKLSEQFEIAFNSQSEIYSTFEKLPEPRAWQTINADDDGIVNLAKYYRHPQHAIFAIAEIYADQPKEVELLFDYTFSMLIGLNTDILFCGTELDTKNFMRVMDAEEKLTLNLKEGKNDLIFVINADDIWQEAVDNPPHLGRRQAVNWGFIARLSNYDGIKLAE